MKFSWDPRKDAANLQKHGIVFAEACGAFEDPHALVAFDAEHSPRGQPELRWRLLGKVSGRVMTVRYTHRPGGMIRIISAGYWRNAARIYEQKNQSH